MKVLKAITLLILLASQVYLLRSIHHNRQIRACEAKAGDISGPDYEAHYRAHLKCYD